jgi:EmrB/QacA subfamily drug resistance transporter
VIDPSHRRLALLVAGCFFMENLDGTMVVTSAPRIGADLGVAASAVGLVVTAYLVTLAVLIPLSGWLVGRLGIRAVFISAIVIFTCASALCASSVDLGELVAMRVLQGVGGAMMVPVGRLAVLGPAAKADLMRLVSYIVWPGLVAPVVAPLLGGVITTYAGWRWLFLVNVPLGVVAFVAARALAPAAAPAGSAPLDWFGLVASGVGLGGLTCAAALASLAAPVWGLVALVAVVSLLALVATGRHLARAAHPLVDLTTLRIATFRTALLTGGVFYLGMAAVPFLLPLLFENVFGWSAVKAGAVVLFLFAGNIGIKPAAASLLNRFGFRTVLVGAGCALAVTMAGLGLVTRSTPVVLIAVVAMLSGMARSIGGTSYNTLIYSDVPESQMAHANTLSATFTQLSLGFGVASAAVALRVGVSLGSVLPGPASPTDRYTVAFALLAAMPLVAAAGAARLSADAGSSVRASVP